MKTGWNGRGTAETGLVLAVGNSRLHWALVDATTIRQTWETPHLPEAIAQSLMRSHFEIPAAQVGAVPQPQDSSAAATGLADFPPLFFAQPPDLWIASVVPAQSQLWQSYPQARPITLSDVPLHNTYATLGIDRALALWGAMQRPGPATATLVIDAGTALTLTGADAEQRLVGGAILPGLGLQVRSLTQQTALLPALKLWDLQTLPGRWATETADAIWSGVIYSVLAGLQTFVEDWRLHFPDSAIALTGGDAAFLYHAWQQQRTGSMTSAAVLKQIQFDPHLLFRGILAVRQRSR